MSSLTHCPLAFYSSNKSEQVTYTYVSQHQDQKGSSNDSEQVALTRISPQKDQRWSSNDSGTNFDAVDKPESGMVMEVWSDLSVYDDPGMVWRCGLICALAWSLIRKDD